MGYVGITPEMKQAINIKNLEMVGTFVSKANQDELDKTGWEFQAFGDHLAGVFKTVPADNFNFISGPMDESFFEQLEEFKAWFGIHLDFISVGIIPGPQSVETVNRLLDLGYRLGSISSFWYLDLDMYEPRVSDPNISDKPTQEDDFKTTALAGFEAKPDSPMYPIFSALFDVCLRLEGLNSVYYLDGKPVGTGSAYPSDDFLMLYNGSTLEEARGMKIQQAMLHHRLAYGKRKGLKHAVVQTAADSTSGRNCQRVGFQLAFPMHFYRKSLK